MPKKWTKEETLAQMSYVMMDIRLLNMEINDLNSKMNVLLNKKASLRLKISKKHKYYNLLKKQLDV